MVAAVVSSIHSTRIHNMINGQKLELVFGWALIFIRCGESQSRVIVLMLYYSTMDDINVKILIYGGASVRAVTLGRRGSIST